MIVYPIGSKENPVIGVASPPGFEWRILGKWPDADTGDTSPETDRTATSPPALEEGQTTERKASRIRRM